MCQMNNSPTPWTAYAVVCMKTNERNVASFRVLWAEFEVFSTTVQWLLLYQYHFIIANIFLNQEKETIDDLSPRGAWPGATSPGISKASSRWTRSTTAESAAARVSGCLRSWTRWSMSSRTRRWRWGSRETPHCSEANTDSTMPSYRSTCTHYFFQQSVPYSVVLFQVWQDKEEVNVNMAALNWILYTKSSAPVALSPQNSARLWWGCSAFPNPSAVSCIGLKIDSMRVIPEWLSSVRMSAKIYCCIET